MVVVVVVSLDAYSWLPHLPSALCLSLAKSTFFPRFPTPFPEHQFSPARHPSQLPSFNRPLPAPRPSHRSLSPHFNQSKHSYPTHLSSLPTDSSLFPAFACVTHLTLPFSLITVKSRFLTLFILQITLNSLHFSTHFPILVPLN